MDLLSDQFPEKLQLTECLDPRQEGLDQARLDQLADGVVTVQVILVEGLEVAADLLVHGAKLVNQVCVLRLSVSGLQLRRQRTSTYIDAVVTIEGA